MRFSLTRIEEGWVTSLTIDKLTGAIGAAADSVVKLANGFKYCISQGKAAYNYICASRERKRLKEISRRAKSLIWYSQGGFVRSIDVYLKNIDPDRSRLSPFRRELCKSPSRYSEERIIEIERGILPGQWSAVKKRIGTIIEEITKLLDDVMKEKSDFILEPAYNTLISTMGARIPILQRISEIPAPATNEEREALRKLSREYKRLLASFSGAIEQLDLYIKGK